MEPVVNEWDLVIKVKHGDTLRRFLAYGHGRSIDHDMSKLRAKIIDLFKFSPDAVLILTYTDEDGDVVTLDDDDELRDAAISQHLNPLRINVQLKNNTPGRSDIKPESVSSSPMRSAQGVTQPPQITSAIDEALKSVPEPVRSALSNLSHDFSLKAAASAPAFTEFVEYFSNLGKSNVGQPSHDPSCVPAGTSNGVSIPLVDPNYTDVSKASTNLISLSTELPSANSFNLVREYNTNQEENGNITWGFGTTAPTVGFDVDFRRNPPVSGSPPMNELPTSLLSVKDNVDLEKEDNPCPNGKSMAPAASLSTPPAYPTVDQNSEYFGMPKPSVSQTYTYRIVDVLNGDSSKQNLIGPSPSPLQTGFHFRGSDHINSHASAYTPDARPSAFCPTGNPYRRSRSHHDSLGPAFHRGVQCDGCGMQPIVGPRFKSNVKEDYDLCNICFSEMGNEADYTRIDRAQYHRCPRLFKEFNIPHSRFQSPSHAFRGYGVRPSRAKLESRFIRDVTILDGALMAPSTPFTKIWRMRNTGTTLWPFGTQLVWISGDQIVCRGPVDLEIPVNGFPVDEEIDIAVDFTAPSRPGQYTSYWRMTSPSGHKFGQRVWVTILVGNSRPSSMTGSFHSDFNLNLPPQSSGQNGLEVIDVNPGPSGISPSEPNFSDTNEKLVKPMVDELLCKSMEPPQLDGLLGAIDGFLQPTSAPVPSASIIDFPTFPLDAPPVAVASSSEAVTDDSSVEQTLLNELEEMGFKQIDLNKEVLRLNEYDLERSVDDLCGYAEWDPLLQELQEMGFYDKEMNKKLLVKNGGSITRVVLDLVAGKKKKD